MLPDRMKKDPFFWLCLHCTMCTHFSLPPLWILVWHLRCVLYFIFFSFGVPSALSPVRCLFCFSIGFSLLSCTHFGRKFIVTFVIIIPCHRYVTIGNRCARSNGDWVLLLVFFFLFPFLIFHVVYFIFSFNFIFLYIRASCIQWIRAKLCAYEKRLIISHENDPLPVNFRNA